MKTFSSTLCLATFLATSLDTVEGTGLMTQLSAEAQGTEAWELLGCSSLTDIPCELERPFCTKDGSGTSIWKDGIETYQWCADNNKWWTKDCRNYALQYGN